MLATAARALLDNGHLLLLALVVLLAAGVSTFVGLPKMEDPRIENRNPTVITALPGASAERVDALVTEPLENAIREIEEVKILRTESRPGISLIRIELDDFTPDTKEVFARLRDKLVDAERQLPRTASKPLFDDQRRAVGYSLIVALGAGDTTTPLTVLGRLATELSDRLRALPGTEVVRRFGMPEEEVAVLVDADELVALGLSPETVAAQIARADAKVPAGVVRAPGRDLDLETRGELDSAARIAEVPLRVDPASGATVRVGDVATIRRQPVEPPAQLSLTDGERTVLVAARITGSTSIGDWTARAQELVRDFADGPAAGLLVDEVFVQERYVSERLGGLLNNLLLGVVVVLLVVFLLMGLRSAVIVGAALPLTASAVMFTLSVLEIPIHQMSIFGMLIALGLLIDNAIVVTDEIAKQRQAGAGVRTAVTEAVRHLTVPLLSSTITTVLSFAPILLLPGNVGDFIGSIAVSVITAVVASFAIAMTITAALAGRFLPPRAGEGDSGQGFWRRGLHTPGLSARFGGLLRGALRRPLLAALAVLSIPVYGFVQAGDRGLVFFPPAERDQFHVEVFLPEGSSVAASTDAARRVEAALRREPEVERVHWVVGASFPAVYYNVIERRDATPQLAHGIVVMGDGDPNTTTEVLRRVQRSLRTEFPELMILARRFGQGPPIDAPVELRLTGPSVVELRRLGEEVAARLHRHPSVLETRATLTAGRPKLWLDAPEDELRLLGRTPTDVSAELRSWLEGSRGGTVLEGPEELPVTVRLPDAERTDLRRLAARGLRTATGGDDLGPAGWIPFETLGSLDLEPETASISRYNGVRSNTVEGWIVDGVNPPDVTNAVLQSLETDGFTLPDGYQLSAGGDAAESGRAISLLLRYAPLLVTLMVASLVLAFRSFALAGVMGLVAIAAAGSGLLALGLYGFPLGFNPFLGVAGLIGIAFNDAIVVLAALRASPAARFGDIPAMVREISGCTRHVLSTTFTTMGGFLPLVLFDGGEFWPPLAVVIGGGVLGSTLLALGLVPALYKLIGVPLERRRAIAMDAREQIQG